ncbi:ribonuclease H-like domain-containing protein [Candidatus Micrarchaeota archaeon]|nr:ribonuclease H-like domain-containing protein [Candidatus Micrarchaeota archaeon]
MKTRAFLLDVESTSLRGKHALRLFLKDEKTKRSFPAYDNAFKPYYYLLPKGDFKAVAKKIVSLKVRDRGKEFGATSVEEVERVIGRKRVQLLKVFAQDPLHVPKLHEATKEFGQSYEHRISFAKRFLIDNGLFPCSLCEVELDGRMIKSIKPIESPAQPEFSTLAFDIEVYTPANAPNPAKDPVIMISAASPGDSPMVISYSKKFSADFVETVPSEKAAIERFCELLREKKVDLLCSYNGDAFDLPYLRERSKKIHASFYPGRVLSNLRTRQAGIRPVTRVPGRIHYDVYPVVDFLDTVGAVRLPRMTLGHAYAEILGKQKTDINKLEIHKAWDAGGAALEHLAKYNLHDSVACLELAQHTLSLEVELSRLSGETLFDTSRSTTGQLVESLLMRRSFERGEVIPNKPKEPEVQARQQNPIEGAYVKTPEAGVYENLAMLDFKSMYPSIIISHNIDPFALNCDCCSKEAHVSPQGHKFCSKIKGLVPTTLEEIIDARRAVQAQMKKTPKESNEYKQLYARQWGLKILANSYYGFLGYARARWYSRECAESTTAWARHYIKQAIEQAEKAGFKVLYADTDSALLQFKPGEEKKIEEFRKSVNSLLPERMELELEDFYPRGIFVSKKQGDAGAKKKYALINRDGKIKIRGFELVRRDWSRVARRLQRSVLEVLLKEGDVKKAKEMVLKVIVELKSGKTPLEDCVIYTQVRKKIKAYEIMSPEVSALQKAQEAGLPYGEYSTIGYVITRSGKSISEKAQPIELAKDYDADYYVNNQVLPAVLKILGALGVDAEDLKTKGTQKGLGDW